MPELYKHVEPHRVSEVAIATMEMLPREGFPAISRAIGRPIDESFGLLNIIDLKGFSYVLLLCLCASRRPPEIVSRGQVQPFLAGEERGPGAFQDLRRVLPRAVRRPPIVRMSGHSRRAGCTASSS